MWWLTLLALLQLLVVARSFPQRLTGLLALSRLPWFLLLVFLLLSLMTVSAEP